MLTFHRNSWPILIAISTTEWMSRNATLLPNSFRTISLPIELVVLCFHPRWCLSFYRIEMNFSSKIIPIFSCETKTSLSFVLLRSILFVGRPLDPKDIAPAVLLSISRTHHWPASPVDYMVNSVVESPVDHERTSAFQQLVNNIEPTIVLHPRYESAARRQKFQKGNTHKVSLTM